VRLGIPLSVEIGWRYMRGRRSRLLRGTARAALVSILVGVAAMVVAMALMAGYTEDLQRKLIGGSAAIVAYPLGDFEPLESDRRRLQEIPDVISISQVAYGQGSLSSTGEMRTIDVTLRGVDAEPSALVPDASMLGDHDGVDGAVLGVDLARRLGVSPGDRLTLVAVDPENLRFRYRRLHFAGTFESGFSEADRSWLILDRRVVAAVGGRSALLEIQVEDPMATEKVAEAAEAVLGERYLVTDWREFNSELFGALRLQKVALFLVLGLIVVVSTFNVASSLVVLTRERLAEIGVLAALGMKPSQIRGLFIFCGLFLGAIGTALGIAIGWSVSWFLTTFEIVSFSDPGVAAIYFISSVPFLVRWTDLLAVLAFSLVSTLAACWLPARHASRLQASVALRHQ